MHFMAYRDAEKDRKRSRKIICLQIIYRFFLSLSSELETSVADFITRHLDIDVFHVKLLDPMKWQENLILNF